MDDRTILKLQRRCVKYAGMKGYDYLSDDFAQYYVLCHLEKPGRDLNIRTVFVDFLRKTYGRMGSAHQQAAYEEKRIYLPLEKALNVPTPETEFKDDLSKCLTKEYDRQVFYEHYVLGMTCKEMCKKRFVTKEALGHTLCKIRRVIREVLKKGSFKFI